MTVKPIKIQSSEQVFAVVADGVQPQEGASSSELKVLASFTSESGSSSYHPAMLEMVWEGSRLRQWVRPLRPVRLIRPKVTHLLDYEEHLQGAIAARVMDYMSTVQALDLRVDLVLSTAALAAVKAMWAHLPEHREGPSLEGFQVIVQDKNGIAWGPFHLDPEDEMVKWPYPGVITSHNRKGGVWTKLKHPITLTPNGDGFRVSDGVFGIDLDELCGIQFALTLSNNDGDWRYAYDTMFHGKVATIGYKQTMPTATTNESK